MIGAILLSAAITFTPVNDPLATGLYSVIPVDSVSAEYSQNLINNGWQGVPWDSQEAIYVPREVAIQLCETDNDCEIAWNAPIAHVQNVDGFDYIY